MSAEGTADVHAEVRGDGPPLVFVHGFADSSDTWAAQVEHFSGRCTTVTWDLPGHGRSRRPDGAPPATRETALAALDGVLDAVLTQVGPPVVLVGHSLGAYLAMCRVARDPEGIGGLALLSTGPGFRDPSRREEWNAFVRSTAESFDLSPDAAGVAEQPDGWLIEHLHEITVPALLLVGEGDTDYHAGMAVLAAKLPAAGPVHEIAGARHNPQVTHATSVNARLDAFLDALQG